MTFEELGITLAPCEALDGLNGLAALAHLATADDVSRLDAVRDTLLRPVALGVELHPVAKDVLATLQARQAASEVSSPGEAPPAAPERRS